MSVTRIANKLITQYFLIVMLAGCAATGPTVCKDGEVSASIENNGSKFCKVTLIFTSTYGVTEYPGVEATFFDASGNTIGSSTYFFDAILPGKSQRKASMLECNGQSIKSMQIVSAVHRNLCYRGRCAPICGVDGKTLTWE
ncbi:MAG: hypothetical protein KJ795_04480 [Gammaproteobacteria bacterium]|nr:hypothetical protein [Gammaproteobacteria bacterium]MBU1775792.1 hypothetical protein [Gammaproteobacteria bacterium]MBU1968980.1 hypothetical protein [Gammaproteobacteria bacterium]